MNLINTIKEKIMNILIKDNNHHIECDKIEDNNYHINIDGNYYSIPILKLIEFINLSDKEFLEFCNDNNSTFNGMKKEYFAYASKKYFDEEYEKENIDENIKYRFFELENKIDISAINEYLETRETDFLKANIDNELKEYILKDLPVEASKLEQAIYIYIKMCRLFTYDDEFFVFNQKGKIADKHKKIKYISKINLTNRKVVCYNFNLIYSYFLNYLKINFKYKDDYFRAEPKYGEFHTWTNFRCDKFIIKADSLPTILYSDMVLAKAKRPLRGLICLNKNKTTQEEFSELVTRMYKLVISQEVKEEDKSLSELLSEYSNTTDNIKEIPLEIRLEVLMKKVKKANVSSIDAFGYILILKHILFDNFDDALKIEISIIRNNVPIERNRKAMASMIITINEDEEMDDYENNKYYYLDYDNTLKPVTLKEIRKKFDEGTFEYFNDMDYMIPGVDGRKRR